MDSYLMVTIVSSNQQTWTSFGKISYCRIVLLLNTMVHLENEHVKLTAK